MTTAGEPTSEERVGTLRGAGVAQFDRRRLARVAAVVLVVGLAAASVAFYVAGAHKNAQIADLRRHGVRVEVTITGCSGLLGGSGSNNAGYTCKGAFTLDGRRNVETIPGDVFYPPGHRIPSVAVPGDPALVTPATMLATEHTSNNVYILPSVLAGLDLIALAALVAWARRRSGAGIGA